MAARSVVGSPDAAWMSMPTLRRLGLRQQIRSPSVLGHRSVLASSGQIAEYQESVRGPRRSLEVGIRPRNDLLGGEPALRCTSPGPPRLRQNSLPPAARERS